MNFKKTLGLVLTAALVSTSLVAVKPAKAATTVVATATATAPTSALKSFNYFFAQRSMLVAGEADSMVVDTNYNGQVQYELWVKSTTDPNAKWQVVSVDGKGNVGYTDAVSGNNSPYAIPVKSGFTFAKGQYSVAVYAKVAGTAGTNSYGHFINSNGVDDGTKTGTEQKFDIVKTTRFNAIASKGNYNDMDSDFAFSSNSFVAGQKVTFKGFAGQNNGAKYKLVVRELGKDITNQTVLNSTYATSVDWTPAEAGTYEVIAWSAPDVNKTAARDGWSITTVTVKAATPVSTTPTVDATTITTKPGLLPGQTFVTLKLTGTTDQSTCSVSFQGTALKYSATNGVFYGTVNSVDAKLLGDPTSYTVTTSTPTPTPTPTAASVDTTTITTKPGLLPGQTFVTVKLAGGVDQTLYNVSFSGTALKYSATNGVFYGTVNTVDATALTTAANYTVAAK
ncbi:hypothetical protein [Clostridium hydrogenum]|uniref:hypothetical protein n=1 Tax=Clostridium hydrogenum TaxID=2855764 RepID=UPI001F3EDF06|nr:hypothetical protein [Clostridium hydrogenum]